MAAGERIDTCAARWRRLRGSWETLEARVLPALTAYFGTLQWRTALEAGMALRAEDLDGSVALPGNEWEPLGDRLYTALSGGASILQSHLSSYRAIFAQMQAVNSNLQDAADALCNAEGAKALAEPLPNSACVAQLVQASAELVALYSMELVLREAIVGDLAGADRRERQVLYLSTWLQQPYLTGRADPLFAMLDLSPEG